MTQLSVQSSPRYFGAREQGSAAAVSVRAPSSRLPGLDGLRALAVAAVVVFHLDSSVARGGFLGVDIFFVLSGFLITRMLTAEMAATGRIAFGAFYRRRARRLLPAVAVLLAAVTLASVFIWHDEVATVPGSVLSSAGYITNWWLIADHQSYFVSAGRPPMLQHLWSLAIEEQFYLVWPVVIALVAGGLSIRGRAGQSVAAWRLRRVVPLALILALASTLWMVRIAVHDDVPYGADTSRIYFGTDTHSMGLLLGAAAGAWTVLWPRRVRAGRDARMGRLGRESLGLICLAGVIYVLLTVDQYRPSLYRGGFLFFDAVVLVVVLTATRGGPVGRLLELAPLRWIGQRSYSIYLWHWPVVVVTRPGLDLHGPPILINLARLGIILLLAEASYRLVELPLRLPSVSRPGDLLRRSEVGAGGGRLALSGLGGTLCLLVLAMTASPLYRGYRQSADLARSALLASPIPGSSAAPSAARPTPIASTALTPTTVTSAAITPTAQAPAATATEGAVPKPSATIAAAPANGSGEQPPTSVPAMSAFGDSVLLGAASALAQAIPKLTLDAVEGRQASVVLSDVVSAHGRNGLAPVVLIATGNNGVISPSQLDSTLSLLRDRSRVVLLTDRVPRDWQDPNNQTLRSVSARYSNVVLVDWQRVSAGHDSWFYADGYHVNQTGAAAYASVVLAAARD
jgi:peptidoglycan/LPS O-acetylase OafA/YrhL